MAPTDLLPEPGGIASLVTWQVAVKAVVFFLVLHFAKMLYQGVRIRTKFRRMQAEGILIPNSHSLLFGHLLLMRRILAPLPADRHNNYLFKELVINWRDHFPPGTTQCPKVIYLDIWPLESQPIAILNDPTLSQAISSDRFPPRDERVKYLGRLVAGPNQLFEWDGAHHRLWRTRLNPGFSMRNLLALIARGRLVDEMEIFRERIRKMCGHGDGDKAWGKVFEMLPLTIDLTFDIICGAALDYSPGEQKGTPTVLQQGLQSISTEYFEFASLTNLHKRLNPYRIWRFHQIHKRMTSMLVPHIEGHFPSSATGGGPSAAEKKNPLRPKTVVDLAMKEIEEQESEGGKKATIPDGFLDDMIGLMKLFIFAGHDTTAINLSFAFHFIQRDPTILAKLRDEFNAVFGTDVAAIGSILRQSPHLINALPYTTAVLKETLRLCPVASSVRQSVPDATLRDPDTNQVLPTEGFVLLTGVFTLQAHPEIWPRPREFLPERWLAQEGDELHSRLAAKYAWRPFEWGPMSCIGQELAMIEMKMALLFVLRDFDLRTALDVLDAQNGKDIKDRPTVWGDPIYQTNVGLGPPTARLPTQVRLLKE